MNQVVAFEKTRRKLDWKQEEVLRNGKRKGEDRRSARKVGRDVKSIGEEE